MKTDQTVPCDSLQMCYKFMRQHSCLMFSTVHRPVTGFVYKDNKRGVESGIGLVDDSACKGQRVNEH